MSWPLVKLGALVAIKTGRLDANAADDEGLYPFFTCSRDPLKINTYAFDCDAILIAGNGDLNVKHYSGKFNAYQRTYVVTSLSDEVLDTRYLFYFMDKYVERLRELSIGGVIKYIKLGMLTDAEIPLPPLAEQKRIAAILDKADAIRRKRQQAIQLADDFLRAVFLDMFGDVIEGAENVVRFSDVAVLDAPMVDPRVDEYIDLIHIGPDRIEKKNGKLLPALTAREEGLISKKFLFDDRYVLYSKIRPYLRKCAMAEEVGLCSADMYPVRPVEGVATKEFLWMLLLSDFFTAYTESLPARANIPKLNREELEAFTFSLPEYSQQLKFSSIVRATNIACQRVVESAADVDGAFESLSQKAFSGQL
ncbi:restriction endonuclease subunit S [Pseudomonas aeruginosa]|uniref:restriction endonuclease subunit S n=1 Tax=Pseudomonas aeruginosa TaxID=287 RepID=UPI004054183F